MRCKPRSSSLVNVYSTTSTHETVPEVAATGTVAVWYHGQLYQAAILARGAAFELFSARNDPGFHPNPRPRSGLAFRRFVHATQVVPVDVPGEFDGTAGPLMMPVGEGWVHEAVFKLSQTPPDRCCAGSAALLAMIRRTVTISRGTSMVKVLSPRQVAGLLEGRPLSGFCHREYDLAHLRTPAELAPINGSSEMSDEVVFVLRWRAADARDYAVPLAREVGPLAPAEVDVTGLSAMPSSLRVGPHVLGTGFTPNGRHIVPEWTTADFADVPLPADTSLAAFTADGQQVVLYSYQPDQHAWLRMCGPQWRHLLEQIPMAGSVGQEFFPIARPPVRLLGSYQGRTVETIADPSGEFRIAARATAGRHPVTGAVRRVHYVTWREVIFTLIRTKDGWHQLRLCQPNAESVTRVGASPIERGIYETWAPVDEVSGWRDVDLAYGCGEVGQVSS